MRIHIVALLKALRGEGAVVAAALAAALAVNALLFGTPLYRSLVAPDSTTGSFERGLARTSERSIAPARDVLVLGDSRIFSGFDAPTADRVAPGLTFVNAGIPGTTPRCWDVFDRALDPGATRYRAVVIPVDSYADDDSAIGSLDGDDHAFDLRYVVFSANLRERARIAASFTGTDGRIEAFFDLLLRGPLVREDVQDFALAPRARFAALAAARAHPDFDAPATREGSLAGLQADFTNDTLVEPPLYPASGLAELRRQVLAIAQPSASYARYRAQWLGPIVRRYRARGTPVIFVRIPARPLHRAPPPPPSGTIAAFAHDDGAIVLPQAPYVALERPDLFADATHLNRSGALRMSALLGRDVARALEALPQPAHAARANPSPHIALAFFGFHAARLGFGIPIRFQSFEFALFMLAIAIAYYVLRDASARRTLLLGASWYFYARWNAYYLAVLLALTTTDYLAALGLERTSGVPRRALLAAAITANAGFLLTAKYADFFSGALASALGLDGDPWALRVLVPVGISFHTFQSISYLVDVARGKVRAQRSYLDYALYIAFFPQLLAGPIVRAATFFGELAPRRALDASRIARGLYQIVLGLFKKSAIADRFAPTADAYFGSIATHAGALAAWSGALAFAMQIYFDFSGYSDIAIGCARVLGFDFPENFRRPYLSWSVTEFWRRWHMTLSVWLRDYLYIPFGGNRHGRLATYRNLMATMLIGGLWHGANWTFIVWGAYHGLALAVERALGIGRSREAPPPRGLRRILATLATFAVVVIGWVFFRAQSLSDAAAALHAMLLVPGGVALLDGPAVFLAAAVIAVEIVVESGVAARLAERPALRGAALAGLLLGLELASYPGAAAEFVYFRF